MITGARIGELLSLRWDDCADGTLTFWKTKNGRVRQVDITPSIAALLEQLPKARTHLFMNRRTQQRLTENGVRHVFNRAVERAGLSTDVTPHTLRHTALSRMIAAGFDDYTVMSISGHSSTRMLARYTHPTAARRAGALETFADDLLGQNLGSTTDREISRDEKLQNCLRDLVDGGGIEPPTSALRTQRSPS